MARTQGQASLDTPQLFGELAILDVQQLLKCGMDAQHGVWGPLGVASPIAVQSCEGWNRPVINSRLPAVEVERNSNAGTFLAAHGYKHCMQINMCKAGQNILPVGMHVMTSNAILTSQLTHWLKKWPTDMIH